MLTLGADHNRGCRECSGGRTNSGGLTTRTNERWAPRSRQMAPHPVPHQQLALTGLGTLVTGDSHHRPVLVTGAPRLHWNRCPGEFQRLQPGGAVPPSDHQHGLCCPVSHLALVR